MRGWRIICVHLCSSVVLLCWSCGKPNAANITLRKENQDLREKIEQLQRDLAAQRSAVASAEQARGTLPTLPQDRLTNLFTAHGIKIGRLSGGAKVNRDSPSDDALKIYVVPTDDAGEPIKAAGTFDVRAFDLRQPGSPLVGQWNFDLEQSRKSWYGQAMLYEFVLTCPLKSPPPHNELTVHVTFTDELTQRKFEAQKVVKLATNP